MQCLVDADHAFVPTEVAKVKAEKKQAAEKEAADAAQAKADEASGKSKKSKKRKAAEEAKPVDAASLAAVAAEGGDETAEAPKKKEKKQKRTKKEKDEAKAAAAAAAAAAGATVASTKKEKDETKTAAADATEETAAPAAEDNTDKSDRTVFVGNVSLDATQKDIAKHFSTCGKVETVRLRFMPIAGCAVDQAGNQKLMMKVCANKKILNTSKDNCNAYVTFAKPESVLNALKLNGSTLLLKKIRVDRETPVIDPRRSVFVGNLPFKMTDEKVWAFFEKQLKSDEDESVVENVRLIRDRESNLGKGFGYVLLKSASLAAKALALNESKLDNRAIRVQVCGKRFKNKKGEEEVKSKHEGVRASAGAKTRIQNKRKGLPVDEPAAKKHKTDAAGKPKKPKHAARKALQAQGLPTKTGDKEKKPFKQTGDKKPFKQAGDKKVFKGKKPQTGDKKAPFKGKKPSGEPKVKAKKPKHAARKARQAAEAAAAAK